MVAENSIIVAFELGSSAIRGVAGKRESDGSIHILAIEQEKINDSIRRGKVHNLKKTTSAITRIKEKLNERLNVYITRAYVGIAGQSLHTASNKVARSTDASQQVTQELIDSLLDENRAIHYPEREILDVAPQEYRVGNELNNEPIGIQADKIEGHYLNIIALAKLQENIRKCMRDANLEVVELFITPMELAKALLPDTGKHSGCALVDIGAETTTIAIFTKNILRHLVTIPLGGKNVTTDLAKLKNLEMEEAEDLKIKYGVAQMSNDKDINYRQLSISNDRTINEKEIQQITSARYGEIVANIWNQICKGKWENDLLSGITLTGGGASMRGLTEAFVSMKEISVSKIKLAKQMLANMQVENSVNTAETGFNSAIALLMSATENCIGEVPEPETRVEEPVVDEGPAVGESENEEDVQEGPTTPAGKAEGISEPEEPKEKKKGLFGRFGSFMKKMVEEDE